MSSNKGYFVGGLFIGTIVGGALGLLFAPGPGEEIRRKIKGNAEDAFGDIFDQAAEYTESLKEQLQDMTDSVTDKVNQYKVQIESKIQEIQDEVNEDLEEIEAMNRALEEESLNNGAEEGVEEGPISDVADKQA